MEVRLPMWARSSMQCIAHAPTVHRADMDAEIGLRKSRCYEQSENRRSVTFIFINIKNDHYEKREVRERV
jgi:hypothetical protein